MNSKLALIVGGTGGLGSAIARRFAQAEYDLLLVSRSESPRARALVAELASQCEIKLLACDVTDAETVTRIIVPALRARVPDCYIHCAGGAESRAVHTMDAAHVETMVANNLSSFLYVLAPVFRAMARRGGAIVAVSSIAGSIGLPGQAAYSGAKAGLDAAVRSAAREGGRFNIRVNAIAPGQIETDSLRLPPDAPLPPLGRRGEPHEVAEAACFLCSPAASFISGAVLPVTGGLYDA